MEKKEAKRMDRYSQFALAAAHEAMNTSGLAGQLDTLDKDRIGVIIASGIGGISTFEEQARVMFERGPNYCTVSACASSAHGVGDAFRLVQRGDADAMVAGGAEATVSPMAVAGFTNMK